MKKIIFLILALSLLYSQCFGFMLIGKTQIDSGSDTITWYYATETITGSAGSGATYGAADDITITTSGTITKIKINIASNTALTELKYAIYYDDSGTWTKVNSDDTASVSGTGVKELDVSVGNQYEASNSEEVRICFAGNGDWTIGSQSGSTGGYYFTHTYANSLPATSVSVTQDATHGTGVGVQ